VDKEISHRNIEKLIWWELFKNTMLVTLISELWDYYKTYGFVSLEFNPIAESMNGEFHMIDAVGKIDDQEQYLQKKHWNDLEIPNNYGFTENAWERYINELDNQTGASLKMKILNPDALIWTLFAWGGGSLVMTDTLWALWYSKNIWNYGECSGNPTREFTYEYTKTLLREMLQNEKSWKYLIIAWAIANFTHIDKTFSGIIDALEEKIEELHNQKITILVRRGGINEKKGLQILEEACKRLKIPAIITGSDTYMTKILQEIKI
jgi:ATP-citrate lyase beta-subunit